MSKLEWREKQALRSTNNKKQQHILSTKIWLNFCQSLLSRFRLMVILYQLIRNGEIVFEGSNPVQDFLFFTLYVRRAKIFLQIIRSTLGTRPLYYKYPKFQ